ncbi:metallophosphoesterase [Cohnella sp.]|uniref:metallophosphoesterase n=1 Tax=Cohnella sp. TaxID=1883426 RepID=UPI003569B9A8
MKAIRLVFVMMIMMMFFYFQYSNQTQASSSTFKIAILPDTQNYSASYPDIYRAQTQWIADNWQAQNIKFVIHEGDIVNNNNTTQWDVARDAMRTLDGVVPYSVTPGNHDMGTNGSADTRDTNLFNTYFPKSKYSGTATFGGVYPAEPNKYDNNYHTFSAGGTNWLVLSLEFGPRDPVLDWANEVVASHPNHRVIVVTHAYMFSDETRYNAGHSWNPHSYGVASEPGGVNDGEEMWQKFVKLHPNISIVVNGHVLNDGQGRRVTVGDHGNKVYQMLANYQNQTNGGNGYLRLLEIDPVNGTMKGTSYSPYLNQYKTDWQNDFLHTDVELGTPAAPTKPVLLDNFNDGNLNGWTIVDEGTISAPSSWSVSSGRAVQTSNIFGPDVPAVDNRKGTFSYYNKTSAMNWNNYSVEAILKSTDDDGVGLMFYYKDPSNYYKVDLDSQRNFRKLFKMKNGVETTLATSTGAYTVGSDMTLKATVRNGKITVTLNGASLFGTVTDNDLTGGTVAMYCWGNQNCYYEDVRVQPADALMSDDFNDGNITGWTVVDEGTISAPSNWSVVRGEVQQSSNIYGPDVSSTSNRKGTFAYYNNSGAFSWTNYSFASVLRSTDDDGIGLLFRYQNQNNYYKLDLDKQRNFVKLFKVVNGVETTLKTATVPGYTQGANTNLEVKVIGNQIQVFQDSIDIFGGPITDNSLVTGTVALYCWGNQNSYFDDVSVDPL